MAKPSTDITAFLRKQILQNPKTSVDELVAAVEAAGYEGTKDQFIKVIYNLRTNIRTKYGVKRIEDLPIHLNKPNVSELIRMLLRKKKNLTEKAARILLETDGLKFTPALFAQIKNVLSKAKKTTKRPSKKAAHKRVRRAAKVGMTVVRNPRRTNDQAKRESLQREIYTQLEDHLYTVLILVSKLEDAELLQDLKVARRRAGARLLKLEGN
jgi:hypothetical protein